MSGQGGKVLPSAEAIALGRKATADNPLRVAVMVSGRGSNMSALVETCRRQSLPVDIVLVTSDRPRPAAFQRAEDLGLQTCSLDRQALGDDMFHQRLVEIFDQARVELIVLAGYMRLLPEAFVHHYLHRIVNIHPSLLPAFPGLKPHQRALEHGVKVSGCTVHLVDSGVDTGPIILQRMVEVRDDDTPESLADRILHEEHIAYPRALALLASGHLQLRGRRVVEVVPEM